MRRASRSSLAFFIFATFWLGWVTVGGLAHANEAARQKVGHWGSLQRLDIQGTKSFRSETIRSAIEKDLDLRFAGHPLAPLEDYLSLLQQRIAAGYQKEGFRDALVTARTDAVTNHLQVVIDEGPRFACGAIQIDGGSESICAYLSQQLAASLPASEDAQAKVIDKNGISRWRWQDFDDQPAKLQDPFWQTGKPLNCRNSFRDRLRRTIERELQNRGYFAAKYEVEFAYDESQRTAALHVQIADLGPAAVLSDLTIEGAERHSKEAILAYLNLELGMPIDGQRLHQIREQLWKSGRFTCVGGQFELEQAEKVAIRLHLEEYGATPTLDQPLSREETVLLKSRQWLLDAPHWGGDLVIETLPRPDLV